MANPGVAGPAIATVLNLLLRMTVYAPRHFQIGNPSNAVHGFHWAVAFLTGEPCLDVAFVREMDKVGNVINLDPRNRFLFFPIFEYFQDLRSICGNSFVATHALIDTRHAG